MKIYFACAITSGREFEPVYQAVVRALMEDRHVVLTAHLAETGASTREAVMESQEVYRRDIAWVRECDVLIAEVACPRMALGTKSVFHWGSGNLFWRCINRVGESPK